MNQREGEVQGGKMSKVTERGRQEQLGAETFLRAMDQGKIRLARLVLEALDGNIVNLRMEHGRTPLMRAALLPDVRQRLRFVKLLLGESPEVNRQDDEGRTALSHACEGGNVEVVKLLVQSNADPEIVDIWGNGALIYGALAGQTHTVEYLVRSFKRLGMDVNRTNLVGNSALQVAQYLGHHDCARILASHSRKWAISKTGNGGPLEDITFKRSPYGQNQGPSITLYRDGERRPHQLLPVSSDKAKKVGASKIPAGHCQSHKQPLQDGNPLSSDDSHEDSLYLHPFPFELFSDVDHGYGNGCDLFQLIEPRVRWEQENSTDGLRPRVGTGTKLSADCNRLLETQRDKVSRVNGANRHPVLLRRAKESLGSASTLSKGYREVRIKSLDKSTENEPVCREQDSSTCTQGLEAWSQCWVKGQDKVIGCLDGLLSPSGGNNTIGLPIVGREGEPRFLVSQIINKEMHKGTSSSNNFRKDMLHPMVVRTGKQPSLVHISSMGNIEGQGRTLKKPSTLESELKMCLAVNANNESAISLPAQDPPCQDTQTGPASTNVPFPRDVDSMLSGKRGSGEEVPEKILNPSDCELEGLEELADPYCKQRLSLPDSSCVPQRKVNHPPRVQRSPPAKSPAAFSILQLFRRFTVPQIKAHTQDQEGYMRGETRSLDDGSKRYRSRAFPSIGDLSRLGGSKVNSTPTQTTDECGGH